VIALYAEVQAAAPEITIPVLHDVVLMTVMRGVETVIWPNPFARTADFGMHYGEAFTKPPIFDPHKGFMEWDGDRWYINTIGHGLFGSELYLRARTCAMPWYGAAALAGAMSALWEYGYEGNGVRPSALDLVYTPLSGLVFGEGRFALWNAAGAIENRTTRIILRAVVDPLGEAERAFGSGC
jgi:hypothetical protein